MLLPAQVLKRAAGLAQPEADAGVCCLGPGAEVQWCELGYGLAGFVELPDDCGGPGGVVAGGQGGQVQSWLAQRVCAVGRQAAGVTGGIDM
jgi:hypothetical protein